MRLGVLGGTFDPVHIAHLRIAEEAADQLSLDKVLLVLSANPPHKKSTAITAVETRWKMLSLACEGNERLEPSRLEIDRNGKSYTIETLRDLLDLYGRETEIFLLVGTDSAREFETWKDHEGILDLAVLVVAARGEDDPDDLPQTLGAAAKRLQFPQIDISSTFIRERVSKGWSIRHLVPDPVRQMIEDHRLYEEPIEESASITETDTNFQGRCE